MIWQERVLMTLSLLTSLPMFSDDQNTTPFRHPPDAVQNFAFRVDPDVDVGHDDVVEVSSLLVLEKRVRHPDFVRVSHGEVFNLT